MTILRTPLFHFLALGAVLFGISEMRDQAERVSATLPIETIIVSAKRMDELVEDYRSRMGRPPTGKERQGLISEEAVDEVLYREALRLGLERGDRTVQHRLIEKIRFIDDDRNAGDAEMYREAVQLDLVKDDYVIRRALIQEITLLIRRSGDRKPSEPELIRFLDEHAEDYRQPARVVYSQVLLPSVEGARRLIEEIESRQLSVGEVLTRSRPLPVSRSRRSSTDAEIRKLFGPEFAERVNRGSLQRWSEPVRSAYGWHLLYLHDRREAADAVLKDVRSQVEQAWYQERRETRFVEAIAGLMKRYYIRVEGEV